jgi:hypothetical protein
MNSYRASGVLRRFAFLRTCRLLYCSAGCKSRHLPLTCKIFLSIIFVAAAANRTKAFAVLLYKQGIYLKQCVRPV